MQAVTHMLVSACILSMVSSVPQIQIYATDIKDLGVTQDPLAVHLLEVYTLNVEKDMDLLTSIKFLVHNTGRRLLQLEGRLAGNGFSLRSGGSSPEEWVVLASLQLCSHNAPIMEMNSCFAEVKVWVDRSVKTLVLKVHGVQEPCNDSCL